MNIIIRIQPAYASSHLRRYILFFNFPSNKDLDDLKVIKSHSQLEIC